MSGPVVVLRQVRLRVGSGAAKPGPAIGQALGPLGLNMSEFCKQFNERTKGYEKDVPLPVMLTAYSDRSFKFIVKSPATSWFIKKCVGVDKGSARPGHNIVGKLHVKHIYEIALCKLNDAHLTKLGPETMCRIIAGSAQSMGIEVVND